MTTAKVDSLTPPAVDANTQMVGRLLAPPDFAKTFADTAANFWYYVHRTWSKLHRDSSWDVRWNITFILTGNLCALLRLESGATGRWVASDAAAGIEHAISPERLRQLNRCIPSADPASLVPALRSIIDLGARVCASIAWQHDLPWPDELAREMRTLTHELTTPLEPS